MNNKTDVDVKYVSPLKKICMTIGELPASYLETMSYYEMLVWFTEFLRNTVIPTVNNNAEAVSELQALYEELRTYVNDYFDNLDVQEEINNKLDKMAQDGSLTTIIKNYVDPIYQQYEMEINNTIDTQNSTISDINETVNEIDSNVDVLTTRMNSFTTLTEGSTTGDAELIDARVGYNGQDYVNLGQSIRGQVKGIFDESNNYITRTRTINLFNKYDILYGYYLTGTGGVNTAGGATMSVSNYIPCNAGDVLIPSTNLSRVYYNSNKEVVEVRTAGATDYTCPANTAYARFTVTTGLLDRYVIYKSTGAGDVSQKYDIPYYTYSITGNYEEVINAREGYNGQIYPNLKIAKNSVDEALFEESKNYVNRTRTINLFNKYDAVKGYYISSNGGLNTGNEFAASNFIPCVANDALIPSTNLTRAYYNSNKELIEYRTNTSQDFVCPAGTAYARFSINLANIDNYVIYKSTGAGDVTPKTGIPYYTYSIIGEINNFADSTYQIFRKVCCVGDSLTEGYVLNSDGETAMVNNNYSWPHYMELTSGNTYLNCGSSGANTSTWLTRANGLQKAQSFGEVQAYIIGLGFNDGLPYEGYHLDLGTTNDIGTNNQTFYGCMSKIVRELHLISPNAFIFMQTIPSTNTERYGGYNDAIKYICNLYKNQYKTHLLDLFNYINMYTTPLLNIDSAQGHFTAIGYNVCSKNLQYIWSKYLNDNSEQFRDLPEYDIG